MTRPLAVVTGASSGIGAATARALASTHEVICVARRTDRITALAAEIGGRAVTCDVSDADQVAALAAAVGDRLAVLVNNAGGALGLESVADADLDSWNDMYATNVIGAARVTKALLPALLAEGGTVVFLTSTAADGGYEGGAGYCRARAAECAIAQSMRLELVGQPVRVSEVAPGMVQTEEFSLTRFGGDRERAEKVYSGIPDPLTAGDVAEVIRWVVAQPPHVNVDRVVVRPLAQAAQHKVHRV